MSKDTYIEHLSVLGYTGINIESSGVDKRYVTYRVGTKYKMIKFNVDTTNDSICSNIYFYENLLCFDDLTLERFYEIYLPIIRDKKLNEFINTKYE